MALGLFPLPEPDMLAKTFSDLGDVLRQHDYAQVTALPFPGRPTHILNEPGVFRRMMNKEPNAYETSPFAPLYYWQFSRRWGDAYLLFRLFSLGEPQPASSVRTILGDRLHESLLALGILVAGGDMVRTRLLATPFGERIYFHDFRSIEEDEKPEFVFLGRCSMRLAAHVSREFGDRAVGRTLDLCTGAGIQALNVAPRARDVTGSDINRRALAFARANARAARVEHARFLESNVFDSIDGTFDVITANTPFLLLHEGSKARDGYGGKYGMEVELRIFEQLDRRLEDRGRSWIVASSAIVGGRNLLVERLDEMYRGTKLTVDLFPISVYYSRPHYDVYEALGVERCILYVVRTVKDGRPYSLTEHHWTPIVTAAHRAKVMYERWSGRRAASA